MKPTRDAIESSLRDLRIALRVCEAELQQTEAEYKGVKARLAEDPDNKELKQRLTYLLSELIAWQKDVNRFEVRIATNEERLEQLGDS